MNGPKARINFFVYFSIITMVSSREARFLFYFTNYFEGTRLFFQNIVVLFLTARTALIKYWDFSLMNKIFFFSPFDFWAFESFSCFRTILLRGPDNRHYVHNLILPDENSDENSDRSWSIRIAASIFPPKNPLLNEQLAATCIGNSCLEHMT